VFDPFSPPILNILIMVRAIKNLLAYKHKKNYIWNIKKDTKVGLIMKPSTFSGTLGPLVWQQV
jgi:hypothetical protein